MSVFTNKVVWVTGASSGIGAELCRQLANKRAVVVLSSRKMESLEKVKN
jgi:short-subunit dehydrogenase